MSFFNRLFKKQKQPSKSAIIKADSDSSESKSKSYVKSDEDFTVCIKTDKELSDEHGFVRPAEELKELIFSRTNGAQSLVFSCGSGVTACVDAYAAVIAGYDDVVVYEGSWAEWGNPANQKPIA